VPAEAALKAAEALARRIETARRHRRVNPGQPSSPETETKAAAAVAERIGEREIGAHK
jgi:hypothetical protein